MANETESSQEHGGRYWRWMDLTYLCPEEINGVSITCGTRELLKAIAFHTNGVTGVTYVAERTLQADLRCHRNKLDRAIAALKAAKLLTTTQMTRANGTWGGNVWRIDFDLLEREVGQKPEDAGLEKAISLIRDIPAGADAPDAETRVSISTARVEQTRSRLFAIAGDFEISVIEEQQLNGSTILLVRPKKGGMVAEMVVAQQTTAAPKPAKAATKPAPVTRRKQKPATAPPAVVDALVALPHVGEMLRSEAESMAAYLITDVGVEARALHHIGSLDESVLLHAANEDVVNKVGYLRRCIQQNFRAWVRETVWPIALDLVSAGKPGLPCTGKQEEALCIAVARALSAIAGDDYTVGAFQPGTPDWLAGKDKAVGWIPITPTHPAPVEDSPDDEDEDEDEDEDDETCEPFDEPIYDEEPEMEPAY